MRLSHARTRASVSARAQEMMRVERQPDDFLTQRETGQSGAKPAPLNSWLQRPKYAWSRVVFRFLCLACGPDYATVSECSHI
jgi:hypothetical protein